jgi:signal transduction histidine kinase
LPGRARTLIGPLAEPWLAGGDGCDRADANEHGRTAFVQILDDGIGGASLERGSGLRGLCDRLATLGGTVDLASPPGSGTTIVAEVPVAAATPTA